MREYDGPNVYAGIDRERAEATAAAVTYASSNGRDRSIDLRQAFTCRADEAPELEEIAGLELAARVAVAYDVAAGLGRELDRGRSRDGVRE